MANLDEIAASLNVKLTTQNTASSDPKANGTKRRAWLINDETATCSEDEKGVYRPLQEEANTESSSKSKSPTLIDYSKGSIDPLYRPLLLSLEDLRGNPLKITQYLFELSKNTTTKITEKVTLSEIMKILVISKDSARTGLRFLLKNSLVERIDFRAGKGGWSKYKLKNELFFELESANKRGL